MNENDKPKSWAGPDGVIDRAIKDAGLYRTQGSPIWTPPNLYTLDWHKEACACYAAGKPNPPGTDEPITSYLRASMRKDGKFVPVVYWYDDYEMPGCTLLCEVDGNIFYEGETLPNGQTPRQIWPYASKHPITIEQYDYYMQHGRWQEMSDAVHEATNFPPPDIHPDSVDIIINLANKLRDEAERLIKVGAANNQEECDQTDVLISELAKLSKHEKDEAWQVAAVDKDPDITPEIKAHHTLYRGKGMGLKAAIKLGDTITTLKKYRLLPFLKKRRDDAIARGEDQPKSTNKMGVRATTLTVLRKAEITNLGETLDAYRRAADDEGVKKALQQWADRYVKANKKAPPGCKLVEEEIAS